MGALETLTRCYLDPAPAGSDGVVGYVGVDVPHELIAAAGLLPRRLRARSAASTVLADRILGPGVDPPTRLVLADLLGAGSRLADLLVLCHDSDSTVRLYTSLRALARAEGSFEVPELHFLDLLHLPSETTARYNLGRIGELRATLERRSGKPVAESALRAAISAANESRRLLGQVQSLRRATPPLLTGVDALAVVGAGTVLPADEYNRLLAVLLDESPELRPRPGRRVYLTGSGHDSPEVYRAIESGGAVVVGEDHDWGEVLADGLVDEEADPVAALAARYATGSALGRRHSSDGHAADASRAAEAAGAEVVVAWIRTGDDARAWDVPALRQLLAGRGIPLAVLVHRDYRLDGGSAAELQAAIA